MQESLHKSLKGLARVQVVVRHHFAPVGRTARLVHHFPERFDIVDVVQDRLFAAQRSRCRINARGRNSQLNARNCITRDDSGGLHLDLRSTSERLLSGD